MDRKPDNQASNPIIQILEDQIQNLQNQVDSLQQKVIQLEAKLITFEQNSKYALSEPLQPLESSKTIQHNIYQEKSQNQPNSITLGKISEEDKIEIIKLGFQFQAQGTISLKKYYESKDPNSLFQLKGYSIKYDSIRRIKLYQQFKLSNN